MKKINYTGYSDLTNCEEEPIHLLGSIQSFGCMVVLNRKTLELSFCSENTTDFFGISAKEILANTVIDFLSLFGGQLTADDIAKVQQAESAILRKTILIADNAYSLLVYGDLHFVFIELEDHPMDATLHSDIIDQSLSFIEIVNKHNDFKSYCQEVTEKVRQLIGYDRVMIYKFDEDFNGEVFAESLSEGLEPFLGLNYPHTDIPPQARELYKKSPLRILVDVNAHPVSLCTLLKDASHSSVNLGHSTLRSASPIHITYLKNMGVSATLTLSIMIEQRLWGLVACHNYKPKYISPAKRQTALLQTQFMASHIHHWERSENYGEVQEKEHIYQSIIEQTLKSSDIFQSITKAAYFIGLTGSTGGAVIRNGQVFTYGKVPNLDQIKAVQNWMKLNFERVFQSSEFSKYYQLSKAFSDSCSGILYYSLDTESDSAIMWFREQLSEGKKWGGNKDEALKKSKDLTPRASFEAWEELVIGKSDPWKAHEIQAGLRLGAYLEREIYIRNITYQKERYEKLNSELQQANEELNQFNWISSHDMKEPLRKIRLFIDQIKSESQSLNQQQSMYFTRIDAAAKRMQVLIDDLLNYAGLSKDNHFESHSLNKLLGEVADCYMVDNPGTKISIDDLGVISCIDFQIKQLFSNLIWNSIKFKKENTHPEITIKRVELSEEDVDRIKPELPDEYMKILYSDNGIGFDPKHNEQIFQVFQRLHSQEEYSGTGIGLAICKKIVETHKGFIYANGTVGEGASFFIVLRVNHQSL
jgi:light-regulated signal transduction histidine kinase (bacteriophytochrome)